LSFDKTLPASNSNDPKFRTRYDYQVNAANSNPGHWGATNNGYCSTACNVAAQDCPTLTVPGMGTLRGICVPGGGQTLPSGVCVASCTTHAQCRFKEGYRCWPIADLLGTPPTFLSEGPRACINPGISGP
jgi:hypothetical protein